MTEPKGRIAGRVEDGIGWVIIDNPARRNLVSLAMWDELAATLDGFERDPAVRAIVVAGAGEAFAAGADISEFEAVRSSPEAAARYEEVQGRAYRALAGSTKPTLAQIRGPCIGGGLGIALNCDLRIAAEDARFGIPAARLGLGYGFAGLKRLVALVGPARAKEIMFTARNLGAAEARAVGLVNHVVPVAELEASARKLAAAIAANAPLTIQAAKLAVEVALRDPSECDLAAVDAAIKACFASADYAEGRAAFRERRKPRFIGK